MNRLHSRQTKYRWNINWTSILTISTGVVSFLLFFTFNNEPFAYGFISTNLLCICIGVLSWISSGYLVKKEYYIINRDILKNGFVKVTLSNERTTEQWLEVNGQLGAAMAVNAPSHRFMLPPIVKEFPPEQLITSFSLATQQKIYRLVIKEIEHGNAINLAVEKKINEFQNQLSLLGYPFELDRLKLLVERRTTHQLKNYDIPSISHLLVYHLDGSYYVLVSSNEAWSYRQIKKFWSDYRTMIISAAIGLFFFLFSLWTIDNNLEGNSWKVASWYGLTAAVLCQIALVFNMLTTFPAVLKHLVGTKK